MPVEFTTSFLTDSLSLFRQYKRLAERAIDQVTDEDLNRTIDPESNSIAIIVRHMTGNMRSRWTDFLTTDGEKPDRNRDREFDETQWTRAELLDRWEAGWKYVFNAVESLTDEDLTRTVYIRGEAHSVMQAINRQLLHYTMHVGQIVLLAKHYRSAEWKSLSIPRKRA